MCPKKKKKKMKKLQKVIIHDTDFDQSFGYVNLIA